MLGFSGFKGNASRKILCQLIVLTFVTWSSTAWAAHKPKDEDCLTCHSDSTLTKDVNGKQVSLFIDKDKLKHSIHGGMFACVDCHTDVKGPVHETTPKKITCAQPSPA